MQSLVLVVAVSVLAVNVSLLLSVKIKICVIRVNSIPLSHVAVPTLSNVLLLPVIPLNVIPLKDVKTPSFPVKSLQIPVLNGIVTIPLSFVYEELLRMLLLPVMVRSLINV